MTPTLLTLRIDDVMRPQPWPIVLEADGYTIVSGRADATTILQWDSPTAGRPSASPKVGYSPVFMGRDGNAFTLEGVFLVVEPTAYEGDLDALREKEARYRAAFERGMASK
jgi:hypothetical protein